MKRKEVVLQQEISDCGVCCLLSIMRHYKQNASLEELRYMSNTTKSGVNAYNLIECAKKMGFEASGKMKEDIEKLSVPFIAHFKLDNGLLHFVVVYEIKKDFITIMDPAKGFKKLKRNDFFKYYDGISITLYPKVSSVKYKPQNTILKKIIVLSKKQASKFLSIVLLNVIFVILSIIVSFSFNMINKNLYVILAFFIFMILKNLMEYLIKHKTNLLESKLSFDVTTDFLNHIFKLPLKYLHIKDSKEIIKRVDELDELEKYYCQIVIDLSMNIIIILPILFILFYINHWLIIIYFLYLFITTVISYLYVRLSKYETCIEEVISSKTVYNSKLMDYIEGLISIRHIRSHSILNNIIDPYKESLIMQNKYCRIINKFNLILNTIKEILLMSILCYFYVTSNSYALTIYFLFNLIITYTDDFQNLIPNQIFLKKYIEKINDFYNLQDEKLRSTKNINGDIYINNLTFSYNNYNNVISSLSMKISVGEHVIIKGKSGSGKSTLCKILNRDYDYKGDIKIGSKNLCKMSYNAVSYASQDEHIFTDTIRNNILLNRNVNKDYLDNIISLCRIDEIIKRKNNGIDHFIISEDELSGGERQRIILARTLINSANILILDEILSEVNSNLEIEIIKNIKNYYKDKTIIYVTHKDNVNKLFDRILYV